MFHSTFAPSAIDLTRSNRLMNNCCDAFFLQDAATGRNEAEFLAVYFSIRPVIVSSGADRSAPATIERPFPFLPAGGPGRKGCSSIFISLSFSVAPSNTTFRISSFGVLNPDRYTGVRLRHLTLSRQPIGSGCGWKMETSKRGAEMDSARMYPVHRQLLIKRINVNDHQDFSLFGDTLQSRSETVRRRICRGLSSRL